MLLSLVMTQGWFNNILINFLSMTREEAIKKFNASVEDLAKEGFTLKVRPTNFMLEIVEVDDNPKEDGKGEKEASKKADA